MKKKIDSEVSKYLAKIGRRGGRVISEKKAETSRENGRLGGRPRKRTRKPAKNGL